MLQKNFLLVLDVDETLLNSKTESRFGFDFNGSKGFNDASGWLGLIDEVEEICRAQGYQLIVKFLSAKISGTVDDTIDACHQFLRAHTALRYSDGGKYKEPTRKSYVAMRHLKGQELIERFFNHNFKDCHNLSTEGFAYANKAQVMPSIHVCNENKETVSREGIKTFITSKATVLEKLRLYYGLTSDHILLVDNSEMVKIDLETGAGGTTPVFNMVYCPQLEELQYHSKVQRTVAANAVFNDIKTQVSKQLMRLLGLQSHAQVEDSIETQGSQGSTIGMANEYGATVALSGNVKTDLVRLIEAYISKDVSILEETTLVCVNNYLSYFFNAYVRSGKVVPDPDQSSTQILNALLKRLKTQTETVFDDEVYHYINQLNYAYPVLSPGLKNLLDDMDNCLKAEKIISLQILR